VNTQDVNGYVVYRVEKLGELPVTVARLDGRDATSFTDWRLHTGDRPGYYVRAVGGRLASVASYTVRPKPKSFCW
jgi:hypothetical protein